MASGIHCCKDCVPPKRHPGCHATCKTYIDERARYDKERHNEKENKEKERMLSRRNFHKLY
jgi:hypothetical protein